MNRLPDKIYHIIEKMIIRYDSKIVKGSMRGAIKLCESEECEEASETVGMFIGNWAQHSLFGGVRIEWAFGEKFELKRL